jgi:hypothetical protein
MKRTLLEYIVVYSSVFVAFLSILLTIALKEDLFWLNYLIIGGFGASFLLLKQNYLKILFSVALLLTILLLILYFQAKRPIEDKFTFLYDYHLRFSFVLIATLISSMLQLVVKNYKYLYYTYIFLVFVALFLCVKPYKYLIDRHNYLELRIESARKSGINLPNEKIVEFAECLYKKFHRDYGYSYNFPDSSAYNLKDHEIIFDCSCDHLIDSNEDFNYENEKKVYLNEVKSQTN